MRKALLSVVVGLAGAAAVSGVGWAVQTVALPEPAHADQIAADAEAWLHHYRFSLDIFHAEEHRFRGVCLRGWYTLHRHSGSHRVLGSVLRLSGGPVVLSASSRRAWLLSGHRRSRLPDFLAVAVGCTRALARQLDAATRLSLQLRVERAYAANQPALALELPRLRDERLTLYVSPLNHRPLVAVASVDGRIATARLYLTRMTQTHAARFRTLVPRSILTPP